MFPRTTQGPLPPNQEQISRSFDNLLVNVVLNHYFPQFHAPLDHSHQPGWLHALCATDAPFSPVLRVVCASHALEQQQH